MDFTVSLKRWCFWFLTAGQLEYDDGWFLWQLTHLNLDLVLVHFLGLHVPAHFTHAGGEVQCCVVCPSFWHLVHLMTFFSMYSLGWVVWALRMMSVWVAAWRFSEVCSVSLNLTSDEGVLPVCCLWSAVMLMLASPSWFLTVSNSPGSTLFRQSQGLVSISGLYAWGGCAVRFLYVSGSVSFFCSDFMFLFETGMKTFACLNEVWCIVNGLNVLSVSDNWSENDLNEYLVWMSSKIMTCSCLLVFLSVCDCWLMCAYVESVRYETLLPKLEALAFEASEAPLDVVVGPLGVKWILNVFVGPLVTIEVDGEQAIIMF